MRFKDLNDEDIKFFTDIYKSSDYTWDQKMKLLASFIGQEKDEEGKLIKPTDSPNYKQKSERTVRNWAKTLGIIENNTPEPEQYEIAKNKSFDREKKRFIISWAQNNTPVNKEFLNNIEAYADIINAEIHIIAGRYKNPTSLFNSDEEFWVKEVIPYLDANRHNVHEFVSIMSDVKIQPTAVNPLSSMAGFSADNSCVFGSPKVHLEVIPVLEGYRSKIMTTTGAVTLKNYTDSKAGKKGEFHHTFGFVIVEIDGDETFIRQVTADNNGSFSDLTYRVDKGKVTGDNTIDGVVLGDIHLGQDDEVIMSSTFEMIDALSPETIVLHDLFDAQSINVHDSKNPFIQYQKEMEGKNNLKSEIELMLTWLGELRELANDIVVVRSNHDDMVDRYLINEDWKKGHIKNALTYMQYSTALLTNEAKNGIIPWVINQTYPEIHTLGLDSSYRLNGWELAVHGHQGSNGARGSVNTFRKLSTKLITAHTHSCSTHDGHMCVGCTCKKKQGYNQGGASSWTNSHVIIHKDYNGDGSSKAQHIIMNPYGKYTTLY